MIVSKPLRTIQIQLHCRLTRSLSEKCESAIMRGYLDDSYCINDAVLGQNRGLTVTCGLDSPT